MTAANFSYAQAARGQSTSQQSPQLTSSSAPSTTDSQAKDDVSTDNTTATAPSVVSNATDGQDLEQNTQPEIEHGLSKLETEGASKHDHTSTVEEVGKAVQEDATATATTQRASDGKNSRSTSRTSKTNDGSDSKKSRKGKKGHAQDKDVQSEQAREDGVGKEVVKPVVLTEAAPPAVNPWAKRAAEVFQGKDKTPSASAAGPSVGSESKRPQLAENSEPQPVINEVNGDKSTQKKAEAPRATDQGPRRSAPRGARANDKDEKSTVSLPSVSDSSFWPEPKAAAAQEQLPVRKAQEKSETSDKEITDEVGPAQKRWKKFEMDHANMYEPAPPARGTKPRGGARGGRDQGSFRGHINGSNTAATLASGMANEKNSAAAGSTGPRASATRPREGSVAARSTAPTQPSMPPKRVSVDGAQRKSSLSINTEQARDEIPISSRRYTKDIRTENGQVSPEGAQTSSRTAPQERSKDASHSTMNGHHHPVRDGRPERTRGNGYRHRGGHNGGAVGTHSSSSSFAGNGHFTPQGGFQARQNSSTHGQSLFGQFNSSFGHQGRGRAGKWAGSNAQSGRSAGLSASFAPKAAQANELAVNYYAPVQYSYQQPYYSQQFQVLVVQIEYYFSVENWCKDVYLRQRVDGAGFTRFDFISGFSRVKQLADDDINLVRMACLFSPKILFVTDERGTEFLRPTFPHYEQFILPEESRHEDYRHSGPKQATPVPGQNLPEVDLQSGTPQNYPGFYPQHYPVYYQEPMFQHQFSHGGHYDYAANGVQMNGYHNSHATQLSAVVPEFTPPEEPVTLDSMTNISDSQVEKLVVVLTTKNSGDESSTPSIVGYVSVQPHHESKGEFHDSQGLNGDAHNNTQVEQPIIWVSGDASGQQARKEYIRVRQSALDQRRDVEDGVTPREMEELYRFWSHMLLHHFNATVYQEFRSLVLEDVSSKDPLRCGLDYLLGFYDKLLLDTETRKPWPAHRAVPSVFTEHYAEAQDLRRSKFGH